MQTNDQVSKDIIGKVVEHMNVPCDSTAVSSKTAQTTKCSICPTGKKLRKSSTGIKKKYWCQ
jgi:hypothetical protein